MNNLRILVSQLWESAYQFWTTPSAQIQAGALLLSIFLSFLFAKRTKPKILHFTLDPTRPAWIGRTARIIAQLLLPLFLLLFSLLARGLLTRFECASVDLLNPFVHATTAWLIYRLVAGLTHNQFWLSWLLCSHLESPPSRALDCSNPHLSFLAPFLCGG